MMIFFDSFAGGWSPLHFDFILSSRFALSEGGSYLFAQDYPDHLFHLKNSTSILTGLMEHSSKLSSLIEILVPGMRPRA